jgi:predicted Zn-dependent protease
LALLYHSRSQELAADQFALELLSEEYGTIQGALEFFALLKQTEKQTSTPEFLRSHPLSTHRLQAINTGAAKTLRD